MNARLARTASDIEAELWSDAESIAALLEADGPISRGELLELAGHLQDAYQAKTNDARKAACDALGKALYHVMVDCVECRAQALAEVE